MIPVRVRANAQTCVVASGMVGEDHPMAAESCPVCDRPIGTAPYSLVYVGTDPERRQGRQWTGAAVAVHSEHTTEKVIDDGE